ncbi:MAG: c-type cytochrome [Pontibacterium sp.]
MGKGFLMSVLTATAVVVLSGCMESEAEKAQRLKLEQGQAVVEGLCISCHGQGINGAPIIGNKIQWGKRAAQGEAVLLEHATQGYEMMPPRGGNPDLTDEDIAAAISYMLAQLPK